MTAYKAMLLVLVLGLVWVLSSFCGEVYTYYYGNRLYSSPVILGKWSHKEEILPRLSHDCLNVTYNSEGRVVAGFTMARGLGRRNRFEIPVNEAEGGHARFTFTGVEKDGTEFADTITVPVDDYRPPKNYPNKPNMVAVLWGWPRAFQNGKVSIEVIKDGRRYKSASHTVFSGMEVSSICNAQPGGI